MTGTLSAQDIEQFVRDGFVRVRCAFPPSVAAAGRARLWELSGADQDDPRTWTQPVIRIDGSGDEPFRAAATTARLAGAFDQLVGPGGWAPRTGLGTFPIRFPHPADPPDTGWHLDGSFTLAGGSSYRVNVVSRGRALLMLFLFSDIGPYDAPTRIKVGSHLDVPDFLKDCGAAGKELAELCREMGRDGKLINPHRATALAEGGAGDVYLCHPFLIHAAQPNYRGRPRFLAQPPLMPTRDLCLDRPGGAYTPVERAIRDGLNPR